MNGVTGAVYGCPVYGTALRHHGIIGQKWGVRRYQNADGTLTDAGKRRLSGKVKFDDDGALKDERQANLGKGYVHANVAADYKALSSGEKAAAEGARSAANIARQSAERDRKKAAQQIDLSQINDRDLQAMVNRMNLERNYRSLAAENVAAGKDYASSILSTAGDVLAIGASIASIAMAIHTIRS